MLFNLFTYTITISKREYRNSDMKKASHLNKCEEKMAKLKSKHLEQHVWNYLSRM